MLIKYVEICRVRYNLLLIFILHLWIVLLLQGCDFGADKKITMPLYQECLPELEKFIESVSGSTSVHFDINKFDVNSDAHPFLIGFVTVKGSEGKDFEIHKNSVQSICLPSAMVATNRDDRGLDRMMRYYDNLRQGGDAYLNITDDNISIFYNERTNKNAISPPGG